MKERIMCIKESYSKKMKIHQTNHETKTKKATENKTKQKQTQLRQSVFGVRNGVQYELVFFFMAPVIHQVASCITLMPYNTAVVTKGNAHCTCVHVYILNAPPNPNF